MKRMAAVVLFAVAPVAARAQTPAGPELHVNTFTTDQQSAAHVSVEPDGDFVVVWTSFGQDGSNAGVFGQRFTAAGAPRGGEFAINGHTTGRQAVARAAVGAAGDFVVAWESVRADPDVGIDARLFDAAGNPVGAEFAVNTHTTGRAFLPAVARAADGSFVVCWNSTGADGSGYGISARRFGPAGNPLGADFVVNTYTTGIQWSASVAMDAAGNFVVAWTDDNALDGSLQGIFAQRFDAAGNRRGGEFQVNTTTLSYQNWPSVSVSPAGEFVVAWASQRFIFNYEIYARRFDAQGNGLGPDFRVNAFTPGHQSPFAGKAVAHDAAGNFVVVWTSEYRDGSHYGVAGRRFSPAGTALGAEFRVNTHTTNIQGYASVGSDAAGNFVVAWDSFNQEAGSYASRGVYAQRFGGQVAEALSVDSAGNRIFEPGETVDVTPAWRNASVLPHTLTGTVATLDGPPGAAYAVLDGAAAYGTLPPNGVGSCSDCYEVSVSDPTPRPVLHGDTSADEQLAGATPGLHKRWSLHVGESFDDVPRSNPFYRFVETLLHHGVTTGCSGTTYCPSAPTTRAQMAVFVLVGREGSGFVPPLTFGCLGVPMFNDVPVNDPFCIWIVELANRGVVAGCGGGNYCPSAAVTREQMAVFVLRTLDPALSPPACGTPVFADVPASSPFCRWVEELARRGIVTGCGGGNYCPAAPVTREQMGVFIGVTFGLTLYGP